jgi:hypothetical protein
MSQKSYNTPKRTCIIKTRLTEQEYADFKKCCAFIHMTQSDFIRLCVSKVRVCPVVVNEIGGEEVLDALSKLLAQCSKIGSNLNQIAHYFNSGGQDSAGIREEVKAALAELTRFRLDAEKVIGEHYGHH